MFASQIPNRKILSFSLFSLVLTILIFNIFFWNNSFAQLGLSPLPATQKVLPSYIIDIPAGAVSSEGALHYVPPKISIPIDTTVAWFNDDPGQVHTVTSGVPNATNSGQVFNSGFMPFGAFYQMTFNTNGDYTYHCTLHPYMTGSIHVGGAAEMGHHFTLTSGADLLPVYRNGNWTIVDWTINQTQNERTLFNFRPLSVAVDRSTPLVYNIKVDNDNNNQTIFNENFQVIGENNLHVEFISNSNMNKTNIYGPDVSDPNTGAYHVERNFEDSNYTIRAQIVSIGNDVVEDNITDEFGLKLVS